MSGTIYEVKQHGSVSVPAKKDDLLNPHVRRLLEKYVEELEAARRGHTPIYVDEIASKIGKFYETIRKVIDWKADNILRRAAVERILKRFLFTKVAGLSITELNTHDVSHSLTNELIRGGHLPNGVIPHSRVEIVDKVIQKYIFALKVELEKNGAFNVKSRINFATKVIEIAACEIEEALTNPVKEHGLINTMTEIVSENISLLPPNALSETDKTRYAFIATCRSLYGLDDNFITYKLLLAKYPAWIGSDENQLRQLAHNFPKILREFETELENPLIRKFTAITDRVDTPFLLLDDVLTLLAETPARIIPTFTDKKKLKEMLEKSYDDRYKTLRKRLFRLAIFTSISVFLSNWLTFFIVEVPLAQLFYEKFNVGAAVADFLIPTVMTFLMVSIIRPPRTENAKRAMEMTFGFVYEDEKSSGYQIRLEETKSPLTRSVLSFLYFGAIIGTLYGVGYVFYWARLPMTSVIFDTFTIALSIFGVVAIANQAKELSVEESGGVHDFILDIFSVPVAKVGSILATKWKEYNIFTIFFNFVIETPFVALLNFIQEWSQYIKERRAEFR